MYGRLDFQTLSVLISQMTGVSFDEKDFVIATEKQKLDVRLYASLPRQEARDLFELDPKLDGIKCRLVVAEASKQFPQPSRSKVTAREKS